MFLVEKKNAPLTYIDDLCEIIYQVVRISPFKGEEYFAFNTDMGIQKFIEQIAIFYKLPLPKRKYSKFIMMSLAVINEYNSMFLRKNSQSFINKRLIDVLSINYIPPLSNLNNNLDWIPTPTNIALKEVLLSMHI